MLIYKEMTTEAWQDLKVRTEAILMTDIKEYRSMVDILDEWIYNHTLVEQFRREEASMYIGKLRQVLTQLKDITRYPKLIDNPEIARKKYIATVPSAPVKDNPEIAVATKSEAPAVPAAWNRYLHFDTYKAQLPDALRQEGEDNIDYWFANRHRLHDLAKNQDKLGVEEKKISLILDELAKQDDEITGYFDRVERYMTEGSVNEPETAARASGKYTKEEIEAMTDVEMAMESKYLRIAANKKYIARMGKDVSDREQYELRLRELREWGVPGYEE